jgi:hypothetical protein
LTTKSTDKVVNGFKYIFKEANVVPEMMETDQGSECIGKKTKDFLRQNKIYFKVKTGANKASVAEHMILLIKRKLFTMLRANFENNWVKR